jgi:hypothetical protein
MSSFNLHCGHVRQVPSHFAEGKKEKRKKKEKTQGSEQESDLFKLT